MNARVCAVNVIQIREDVVCRLKDTPLYTNIAVIYKYKETSANAFELSLANNNEIYDGFHCEFHRRFVATPDLGNLCGVDDQGIKSKRGGRQAGSNLLWNFGFRSESIVAYVTGGKPRISAATAVPAEFMRRILPADSNRSPAS